MGIVLVSFHYLACAQEGLPRDAGPSIEISGFKISTVQKKLDDAAAAGYRATMAWAKQQTWKQELPPKLYRGGLRMHLEKVATPPETYAYRLITGGPANVPKMQKQMNEAGAAGYHLIPAGWFPLERDVMEMGAGLTYVAVLEKAPGQPKPCQFLILGAGKSAALEKQITQASAEGFQTEETTVTVQGDHIAVMSKELKQ